jgi:hypothetical protein
MTELQPEPTTEPANGSVEGDHVEKGTGLPAGKAADADTSKQQRRQKVRSSPATQPLCQRQTWLARVGHGARRRAATTSATPTARAGEAQPAPGKPRSAPLGLGVTAARLLPAGLPAGL